MGIVIDIDFLYLEFYVVGIMFVVLFNYYLVEINDKIDFFREYWFYEFVFYKINIWFFEDRIGMCFDIVFKYYMFFGVGVFVVLFIWRWKR